MKKICGLDLILGVLQRQHAGGDVVVQLPTSYGGRVPRHDRRHIA